MPVFTLHLQSCDCRFDIRCGSDHVAALISGVFGALAVTPVAGPAHRECYVDSTARGTYRLSSGGVAHEFSDADELLFHIDKSIIIELQHLRADLLFVHGAVIAWRGRVAVLSAPPGTGKSTLTMVALQLGFEYFSDELAPIDLHRLRVYPHARAVYLKTPPPLPHSLPADALDHGGRYHVPVTTGLTSPPSGAAPLAALLFLRRDADRFNGLRLLSAAAGAANLMANTLNLLAHPSAGLDAAAAVCQAVSCFELDATNLTAAIEAVRSELDREGV